MVFAVFTGSIELAFRSHCDFEGLVEQTIVSADPALQGKRRVKQCLPLKSSSNVSLLQSLLQNVSNGFLQSTCLHRFPEMLSLNVI